MPRKSKKSYAAKVQWEKQKESYCAATSEPTQSVDPETTKEVNVFTESPAEGLHQSGKCDAVSEPKVSYADVVKRHSVSQSVAGPSVDVNHRDPPCETRLSASYSQASQRYGINRNSQCTCNSLTFLAFLYENENLTKADLNLVLDKGNVMYKQVRRRFPQHIHLATDELPDVAAARRFVYQVDKTRSSRYGTFGEPLPGAVDSFLDLEAGLSCLLSDVQYALLLMKGLCIAVFRTRSGRYGLFDPHSRRADGLPLSSGLDLSGTAVMLTFTCLSDMIDRITRCYQMFHTQSSCNYELKPVEFYTEDPVNMSDAVQHTESTSTTSAAVSTNQTETSINTDDTLHEASTDMEMQFSCNTADASNHESRSAVQHTDDTNDNIDEGETTDISSVSSVRPETSNENISLSLHDAVHGESSLSDVVNDVSDMSSKLSKLSKSERRKFKRRSMISEKEPQRKINQKRRESEKYGTNETFRAKKKSYSSGKYQNNPEFRQNKMNNIKTLYRENVHFRQKQKQKVKNYYRGDAEIKNKKIQYIMNRYRENVHIREKQRHYLTQRYRQDVDFRNKQKIYIKNLYRNDVDFRNKQKQYMISLYRDNVDLRNKQKTYKKNLYRDDVDFRLRKRSYMSQRYTSDQTFRLRHRQLMKQIRRDRYKNILIYRTMYNIRCAMKIKQKYRSITKPQSENQPDNSLIKEAISVFRSQIKFGPTYACTVCHKASFPNQVQPCVRSKYIKNQDVVAEYLTGKYVHVCNDECRNEPQCKVPDERKREWICHTCHNYLKRGFMPSLAVANNMGLADIPAELCDLNILERHLIAKCIPFAKIIPLPKGRQNCIRGNVVCVPSEVQETVEALPRLRSESQVLRVKLKRRLCYKGHQLFQTVTWTKLIQALHKLRRIHPQYEDISIRDEAELCDPTLPDDDDDDDDAMDDGEYGEDELMEIDGFDSRALQETETDPDNDQQNTDVLTDNNDQPDDAGQEGDMPNGGFALESCLQPTDVSEEILSFSEGIYSVAPAERNNPVSFFKTPNLEAQAFPVQFPTGKNTLDEQRLIKLTPTKYFKSRLFCIDDRFARDANYLFFAQFVTEIHLATSSMSIQLRKGKPVTRDGRRINSRMLQNKQEVERLVRNKDAVRFMQPLRGTPAYWEKTTKDLFAMIRQLGIPTFFCTFSAAEMRWPEVTEAIKRQQGENVNFNELGWTEKTDILRSNAVTAMRMFDKRVEALFRDLILSNAQVLGHVVEYFIRLEFQNRGSPHIHCLLWVEGAPVFDQDDDQTVCDFVSRYITAQLPDPNTQPELYKKVTEVQMHSKNHSKSCVKYIGADCRFGFPKPPCDRTMINRPKVTEHNGDDAEALPLVEAKNKLRPVNRLLNESETASLRLEQLLAQCDLTLSEYKQCLRMMNKCSTVILKRDPKDSWVNAYNPHLLEAWDGNMDVSYLLNAQSVIVYLCSYMCKKEAGLSEYLKTVIQNSDRDNVNECDEMRAVMQAYSKKREISAQECVARACSIKMKQCSRGFVFIPTDDNALKMSRPMSQLDDATPESENVWMTSMTDKYKCRPETPEFETMCLADFAATCRFVYGKDTKGKNVLPLLNQMGYVQRRTNDKCAIIRFFRPSEKKHPEKHYGTLLKLYLPYRSEQELKRHYLPTYESFYNRGVVQLAGCDRPEAVREIIKQNKKKYERNSKEVEVAVEEYEQNKGVIDEWCNLAPESELVRLECIEEMEAREPENENEQENVPDYSRKADAVTESRAIREPPVMDPAVLRQMYQSLNQKQACIFYAVRDWCFKRVCGLNPDQFFLYICGGAGCGKSHLIKCIYSEASKILSKLPRHTDEPDLSSPTVLLTAFTGTAAFGISGTTLHSLLKLPRSLKPPFQGLGNHLDEVRADLLNAEIIIIDEISMVSKPLLAYVDVRLKQIKGSNKPFGGMSVLAVGDFYQLPPVRQSKPLCVNDPLEIDLWREHFQMVTLTEIMRQKDDVVFAEMLNRIRVKDKLDELSEADRDLLSQTITQPALCPKDVLHIFATNRQVHEHNTATLSLLHSNIISIDADDYKKDLQSGKMSLQAKPVKGGKNELPDTLQVAEGARVMLTRNLDISQGLVNGSFATLIKVVMSEHAHVTKLGLRMDNKTTSGGSDGLVYIDRAEDTLKQKGVVRRQFPIKLAFACTIHKVQGMTTTSAVVSLKHIFEPGMAYVALSRVTSLSGLYLLDLDERKIYANPEITNALNNMRQASFDEMMPLFQIRQTLSSHDTLTIIHHNTEGLPSHISDIKSHHELCLADVLCLTETHLHGSFVAQSLQLEGYNMFKRNRHLSYSKFPQMADRVGGGVAVYVKDHIQVQEKQYLHNVTDLEFVALKVEAPVPALIAAVYRPPDYRLPLFLSNLGSLLDALEIMDCQPVIVCGDFNENLLSNASKPILEMFNTRGYAQLINSATTEKNSLLDLMFISRPEQCLCCGVMKTYYSYHDPVYCVLSSSSL